MNYMMAEVVPRVFACFVSQGYPSAMDLQNVSGTPKAWTPLPCGTPNPL